MKKIIAAVTALAAALLLGVTAYAESGEYKNAFELYQAWQETRADDYEKSPYPDYVCGVWSTDGSVENLTIAVTKDEAGERGKQEILELVEDDSTLSFTYRSYPYSELWEINCEMIGRLGDETGAFGVGVDEMGNFISVDINTANPGSKAFMEECFERYGNRIRFEEGSGVSLTAEELGYVKRAGGDKGEERGFMPLFAVGAAAFAAVAVFCYIRRRRFVKQLASGTEEETERMRYKDIKNSIKESTCETNTTFQDIADRLNK